MWEAPLVGCNAALAIVKDLAKVTEMVVMVSHEEAMLHVM